MDENIKELKVPNNFKQHVEKYNGSFGTIDQPKYFDNPQTQDFVDFLKLPNLISSKKKKFEKKQVKKEENPEEILLD